MSADLEEALARTMTGAAHLAPVPGSEFEAAVRGRRRALRRRRRTAVAGACGVLVTVLAAAGAVVLTRPEPPAETPASVITDDFADMLTPDKVWPKSATRLPLTRPGGGRYAVLAALGDGKYLIAARDLPSLGVYEPAANHVAAYLGPPREVDKTWTRTWVPDYPVGSGTVLWHSGGRAHETELWAAPTDPDKAPVPQRVYVKRGGYWSTDTAATMPDGSLIFGVYEAPLVANRAEGVYRMPDGGGPPSLIPGTRDWFVTPQAPWLMRHRYLSGPGQTAELWNFVTGERRTVRPADPTTTHIECTPAWCAGQAAGGSFAQRPDGSDFTLVPDTELARLSGNGRLVLLAHYSGHQFDGEIAWDPETGLAGAVRTSTDREWVESGNFTGPAALSWPDGGTLVVFDLTKRR